VPGLKSDYIPQNVPPSDVPAEAWARPEAAGKVPA
jgi:cytochrome c oxidase subunit 1